MDNIAGHSIASNETVAVNDSILFITFSRYILTMDTIISFSSSGRIQRLVASQRTNIGVSGEAFDETCHFEMKHSYSGVRGR